MEFLSICSGIEAASVAWTPIGWKAVGFSEIDPFACAVLAHRFPDVPNYGDMTTLTRRILLGEVPAPDVLCGGTPCQAFSVAGLRESLSDARGNLSLIFCEIADAIDVARSRAGKPPCTIIWENVPGVLSTKDNAFGCFLAGLAGEDAALEPPGGRWANSGAVYGPARAAAWRTLDAQYFGVAQRRRRVFVVSSSRAGFDPAEILFEWDSMRRDSAPRRQTGERTAPTIAGCSNGGGANGPGRDVDSVESLVPTLARCVTTGEGKRQDWETTTMVAHSPRGEGFDASKDGTGRGTPLVPVVFDTTNITSPANGSNPQPGDPYHTLAKGQHPPTIALALRGRDGGATAELGDDAAFALRASSGGGDKPHVMAYTTKMHNTGSNNAGKLFEERSPCLDANSPAPALLTPMAVRRLTPRECERLQGFPDDWTLVPYRGKPAADGPRYKAIGNSWAVPVARWVGERVQMVENMREAKHGQTKRTA